ncbi:hypothetical protein VTN96DRAFT_5856 [Rasamsonia emersonii]
MADQSPSEKPSASVEATAVASPDIDAVAEEISACLENMLGAVNTHRENVERISDLMTKNRLMIAPRVPGEKPE